VAIAFGLGGRDAAARILDRYVDNGRPAARRSTRPPRIERTPLDDEDENQPPLV
jgi:hypothetical protein